jgi:hypothetical protein
MSLIGIAIANAVLWGTIIVLLLVRMQNARRLEEQIERVEATVDETTPDEPNG